MVRDLVMHGADCVLAAATHWTVDGELLTVFASILMLNGERKLIPSCPLMPSPYAPTGVIALTGFSFTKLLRNVVIRPSPFTRTGIVRARCRPRAGRAIGRKALIVKAASEL